MDCVFFPSLSPFLYNLGRSRCGRSFNFTLLFSPFVFIVSDVIKHGRFSLPPNAIHTYVAVISPSLTYRCLHLVIVVN